MTVLLEAGVGEQRMATWSIVLPVKRLDRAKSRLALPGSARRALTLAMALDTALAALECAAVAHVVVVTDDRAVTERVRALGATVTTDEPAAGLDEALAHGARTARTGAPNAAVAALAADLPALKPAELARALDAAASYRRAVVSDVAGTGTTLLTAGDGVELIPSFGAGSWSRHVESGAVALDLDGVDGLRRDVDTLDDLHIARALGVGSHTTEIWNSLTQ